MNKETLIASECGMGAGGSVTMLAGILKDIGKHSAVSALRATAYLFSTDIMRKPTPVWPRRNSRAKRKRLTAGFRREEDLRWRRALSVRRMKVAEIMGHQAVLALTNGAVIRLMSAEGAK